MKWPAKQAKAGQTLTTTFLAGDPRPMKIEVSHCVHCQRLTFNAESDMCSCGAELYPISKTIEAGKAVGLDELGLSWEVRAHVPCSGCGQIILGGHACPGRPEDHSDYGILILNIEDGLRIQAIKVLRDELRLDLRTAANIVRSTPTSLVATFSRERALELKNAFERVGTTVEVYPADNAGRRLV